MQKMMPHGGEHVKLDVLGGKAPNVSHLNVLPGALLLLEQGPRGLHQAAARVIAPDRNASIQKLAARYHHFPRKRE